MACCVLIVLCETLPPALRTRCITTPRGQPCKQPMMRASGVRINQLHTFCTSLCAMLIVLCICERDFLNVTYSHKFDKPGAYHAICSMIQSTDVVRNNL
jgi:hypothetical protein